MNTLTNLRALHHCCWALCLGLLPLALVAQEAVGTLKSLKGQAQLEREGVRRPARAGEALQARDRLLTGSDGHASVGLRDESALAIGPNSDVALSRYRFDPVTHQGEQQMALKSGSLAAISGKLAKASPQAVQFNAGTMTLGVRGTLLVRVPVLADATDEPAETFTLTATPTGTANTAVTGTASIVDDGNGDVFKADGTVDANAVLDDDRALSITSPTVNEGSPYALLTLGGAAGQQVSLNLAAGTATANIDYQGTLEYFDGTWKTYTGGTVPLDANGQLLLRVPIEADALADSGETFTVTAKNTGGAAAVGTTTIVDNGTGDFFDFVSPSSATLKAAPPSSSKDDDRLLSVDAPVVNEGSPYLVFKITGAPLQKANLRLGASGDSATSGADFQASMEVSVDGLSWAPYASAQVSLGAQGSLMVRIPLVQDVLLEKSETLTLTATNGGGLTAEGTARIVDEGNGELFLANGSVDAGSRKDDDRAVAALAPAPAAPAAPVMAAPLQPSPPQVHVMVAVAQARQASAAGGEATAGTSGLAAATVSTQRLDALSAKFDRPTDPNVFVLPAVSESRSQSYEAKLPALSNQSGLLGTQSTVPVLLDLSPALSSLLQLPATLADQTLAALAGPADASQAVEAPTQQELQWQALMQATAEPERVQAERKGSQPFSRQLKEAGALRAMAHASPARA
jgi:hypothetical protein